MDSGVNLQIKGVRDGLLIAVGEGEWPAVLSAILDHIDARQAFFKGAHLTLEVGNRVLHAAELGTLRDRLSDRGVTLWAIGGEKVPVERAQAPSLVPAVAVGPTSAAATWHF